MTPADAVHGAALPVSKPGLPSFWPGLPQPPVGLITHENEVLPVRWVGLVLSVAVTVTLYVVAVVGVPEITPVEALIARPAGRPVADQLYGVTPPEADMVRLVAVPTVPVWVPGFVTVTLPPPPPKMVCEISQSPVPPTESFDQVPCM